MSLLILVVDDEADVEVLFRQQFRRDLRAGRFTMEFAPSAPMISSLHDRARRGADRLHVCVRLKNWTVWWLSRREVFQLAVCVLWC